MLKYSLNVNGIGVNFSKLENDKNRGFIYVWVGDKIIIQISPNDYQIKYKFKGIYSGTYFFDLIKR